MKIRIAKEEDLKKIVNIFLAESKKRLYLQKWTKESATDDFKPSLKKKELWVVAIDKKIVGFILAGVISSNKKAVYVSEFWITKNYQGKGVGKNLLASVEKYHKKKGINMFRLASHKKAKALDFYKKLNYKESEDLIFMDKKL